MPTTNSEGNGVRIPPIAPPSADADSRGRARLVIPSPKIVVATVPIVGISPLVTHPYPEKLLKQWQEERSRDAEVEEKPAGKKGTKKALPPRNYEEEYRASLYHLDGGQGYGMPAIAFKRALVDACKLVGNIDPWTANMILFVHGPHQSSGVACVKLIGEPHVRRDTVKLQGQGRNKPPDNRFRAEFDPWETELMIEFDSSFIKLKSVYNLIQRAGYHCGVGEMRPTAPFKPNDFGRWRLKLEEEIARSEAQAAASTKRTRKRS
jgi:hypothetical protein